MPYLDVKPYHALPLIEKNRQQTHIKDNFGHIAFVRQRQWAKPDISFSLKKDNELLAFFHIVLREVEFDEIIVPIAGLSNLITVQEHQGKGYASTLLTQGFSILFNQLNVQHSLLLCKDELIPFYQKNHWYTVNAKVLFKQDQGIEIYRSNTLLCSANTQLNPNYINLNGLPW
ncbi:GNAT family N-acetyltransferase [uncultured Shewanella sp.]|uniref:GNAT family N-acetyltransferase n=1 Tax=uncultured Shewanella sp. TaxID=173975 RepID=UPI00262FE4E4|nr:GNAT family N-acetyltransferase [uncultured Shewanella sp.]